MKDYEVCRLVQGQWKFDAKITAHGRREVMKRLREFADYREGCVRVRVLQ